MTPVFMPEIQPATALPIDRLIDSLESAEHEIREIESRSTGNRWPGSTHEELVATEKQHQRIRVLRALISEALTISRAYSEGPKP